MSARPVIAFLFLALNCTESSPTRSSADAGEAGVSERRCSDQKSSLVDALKGERACTSDADCVQYNALCAQEDSGNCAGIFYVSASQISQLNQLLAALDTCLGSSCNDGPKCGLAGLAPSCVDGLCVSRSP